MKIKKRHFSLIEVLISLALMSLILSTLSYFFYHVSILHVASQKEQNKMFRLRYIETRLADTLPKTISPNDPLKDFYFFTATSSETIYQAGSPHLVFTFDNCVNLVDPLFSNHVLGSLFIDNQGQLTLALAPSPKKWEPNQPVPVQREVLLENVESMTFDFYIPPEQENTTQKKGAQEKPETSGGWVQEWKYTYNQLPAMVKITLIMADADPSHKKKVLVFPLANVEQNILYGYNQ
jgi:type II secretory pathway pseudopilin PulG